MAIEPLILLNGTTADANQVMALFNEIYSNITDVNIASGAGITFSKLDPATVASVSTVQTLSNKTFSDNIVWKSGTAFTGTLDHINTAARVYSFPDSTGNVPSLPTTATTETGSGAIVRAISPTLTTPTIASFINAQHNHQNAVGGGVLDATAINSGILPVIRGGTGVALSTGSTSVVLSASPTLSGTIGGNLTWSGTQTFLNNMYVGALVNDNYIATAGGAGININISGTNKVQIASGVVNLNAVNLVPIGVTGTQDIGAILNKWRDGYFARDMFIDRTLTLSNVASPETLVPAVTGTNNIGSASLAFANYYMTTRLIYATSTGRYIDFSPSSLQITAESGVSFSTLSVAPAASVSATASNIFITGQPSGGGANTLYTVNVGVANSGGAGQRVLTIAN